jgi:hypothetical protein
LKIQYFPSQKNIFNTSENKIIIVKATKVEGAQQFFCGEFSPFVEFFSKHNIMLNISLFLIQKLIKFSLKSPCFYTLFKQVASS